MGPNVLTERAQRIVDRNHAAAAAAAAAAASAGLAAGTQHGPHSSIYDDPGYAAINTGFPLLRAVCLQPPIRLVDNFLTAPQCHAIIEEARPRLAPSVVHNAGGDTPAQTSASTELAGPLARIVLNQACQLTNQPVEHMEMPTVARYLSGQRYVQHHDAFPPGDILASSQFGGNRICTVLVYLNDVPNGGRTAFPRAGVAVAPRCGRALLFHPAFFNSGKCKLRHTVLRARDLVSALPLLVLQVGFTLPTSRSLRRILV